MERISGFSAAEVLGRPAEELFPFLVETGEIRLMQRTLEGEATLSPEQRFTIPETGQHGYFEGRYFPLQDAQGVVQGGLGIIRDVTAEREFHRQQQVLAENRQQLQTIIDAVPALISFIDPECRYRLLNRAYEDWFGFDREAILGRTVREVVGDQTWAVLETPMREALSGRRSGYEQFLPVGSHPHRWFSTTYTPHLDQEGSVDGLVALVYDITAQKNAVERQRVLAEASQTLGASLDYTATLQQVARLAIPHLADFCIVDVVEQGEIRRIATTHADPEVEILLHELQRRFPPHWKSTIPAVRVLQSGVPELLRDVDAAVIAAHTQDPRHGELIRKIGIRSHLAVPLCARGQTLGAISLAFTRPDRRYTEEDQRLVEELALRAATAIDNARLYHAAQQEIEERRRAEDSLRLHSRVLESMREGVSVCNAEGIIVYTNPAEDAIFGYEAGELVGQHVTVQNDYPPKENSRIVAEVIDTLKREGVWTGEWRNRRKDGTSFFTRARITALETGGQQYWVCVQEDITEQRRAEAALRDSEERYRSLVAATTSIVWTRDPDGRFVEPQPSWETYTGQPWEEHQGWGWRQMVHPDDREQITRTWERACQDRALYEAYGRVYHAASGQYRHSVAYGVPVRDNAGEIRVWVGTITDIHDRVRAEQALVEETRTVETINRIGQLLAGELDLQQLLQALTDAATAISDAQFGSFFYKIPNEQADSYVLYTLSGVPHEAFAQFPTPRNTAVFGSTFRGEGVVRLDDVTLDARYGQNAPYKGLPDGHLPVRSYLAIPVVSRTAEVLGGLFFGHAQPGVFTERHERILVGIAAQAAIAIDNARLYQQAREAERAAKQRAEELAAANQQKDDFLAMLAHELRNPLAALSNSIHVMERSTPGGAQFRRAHQVAARQISHQSRLVDDLLDVSRIARGKIRLQPKELDLTRLTQEATEDHRAALEEAGISLFLHLPEETITVQGDEVRLAQVLGNLLHNAQKFTPKGGRVRVTLELSPQGEALLRISDTGVGVEPEVLPRLFTPFAQADRSLDRSLGGLGLGLALVKGLVELHEGGRVAVTSAGVNCGTEFTIALPAQALAKQTEPAVPASPSVPHSLRVLVIEDLPDAAETLRDLLELFGHAVDTTGTGTAGLARISEFQPDVVLCDIGLPGGLSGYDVAREVRRRPGGAALRLIALTGYGTAEDRRQALEAGFDLHLTKPVQPELLQEALSGLHARGLAGQSTLADDHG